MILTAGEPYELLWKFKCNGSVISIHTTPNCSRIAVGSVDSRLRLLDWMGRQIWEKELDNEIWTVRISKTGNYLVAGTANKNPEAGRVHIYDNSGAQLLNYDIKSPVWSVGISNDGESVVATSWNNCAYFFKRNGNAYKNVGNCFMGSRGIYGDDISENGQRYFVAAYDLGVFLLDDKFKITRRIKGELKTGLY